MRSPLLLLVAVLLAACSEPAPRVEVILEQAPTVNCAAPPHGTVLLLAETNGSTTCLVGACEPGWADCDGNPENGCEADLTNAETCGDCSNACPVPTSCQVAMCDPTVGRCYLVSVQAGGPCELPAGDDGVCSLTTSDATDTVCCPFSGPC